MAAGAGCADAAPSKRIILYFNDHHYVLRVLKMKIKYVISTLIINLTRGRSFFRLVRTSRIIFHPSIIVPPLHGDVALLLRSLHSRTVAPL